mmetsp:Transcript_22036/g.56239  ORF Transcript_22036/g.56239 Transcript_22036/m.56239 type:complete len:112 (-) Transcript_22036:501-836(-)
MLDASVCSIQRSRTRLTCTSKLTAPGYVWVVMHACAPAATPLSASARDLDAHAVMPHSPARPPPPSLGRDLGTACFAHAAAIWNVRQAVPEEGAKLYDDAHKDDHTQKVGW